MDMMISYEEDLQTNPFYMKLMEKSSLLHEITINNWIVAVPKRVMINDKCLSSHEFLLAHVLLPSDELPKTHFYNMIGDEVIINGKFIKLKSDASRSFKILFEEFFYTKDHQKFKLLCLDTPLCTQFASNGSSTSSQIVNNVQESWQLVQEIGKKQVERKVSNAIKNFHLRINKLSDYTKIESNLKLLYEYCVNLVCKRKMKEADPFTYMNLKIAIEYILMDAAYEKIFDMISIETCEESQKFNKFLRKMSNISLDDMKIPPAITSERLNPVKLELLKISNSKCALEKLACIKNVIDGISTLSEKKMTITDEMLPILVYLVIKANYFHWIPTLKFIKEFNLSQVVSPENQSASGLLYILTTLEAVMYFIQTNEDLRIQNNFIVKPIKVDEIACKEDYLQYLFEYIKDNNEIQLTSMLQVPYSEYKSRNKEESSSCHPLCTCEKCEARGGFDSEFSNVNVPSYDGITMLHVAAIYNLPKIITTLTNHDANVNIQDSNGMSPLHYAAVLGHQKVLFLLLHAESNLNLRNNKQQTPLILAAMNGHEHCVKALLFFAEHTHTSIDMNAQDSDGMTALHHSAQCGFEIILDILLEYQAKATIKNSFGKIAIDYAFNSVMLKKLEDAIKYQVEELPITEDEFVFIRSDDLADIFNDT